MWAFTDPELSVSSATTPPSQETGELMIHTDNLDDVRDDVSATMVTAAATSSATTEEHEEEKMIFPSLPMDYAVVVYGFPSVVAVGLVSNILSFVTILNSSIRQTSTGLYLSVLAAVVLLNLFTWISAIWALPVLGRDLPPFHICYIKQFCLPVFVNLSSLCIVCVTTDRFLAVWFPFKAKTLTTRRRAGIVLLSVTCALLALYLPVLWGFGRNCEILPNLSLYTTSAFYVIANAFSYGTAIYLFCVNIAISVKLAVPSSMLQETAVSTARESQSSKIIVTVLLVSFAFLICSVPYTVVLTTRAAGVLIFRNALTEEVVFTFCRVLLLINYGVNFFLYIFSSSNFRRSLLELFCGRCRNPVTIKGQTRSEQATVSSQVTVRQA